MRGLIVESSGLETPTHKIRAECAPGGTAGTVAVGMTGADAVVCNHVSTVGFGIKELGVWFIQCGLKTTTAIYEANRLYGSLRPGLTSKSNNGEWTANDNHH